MLQRVRTFRHIHGWLLVDLIRFAKAQMLLFLGLNFLGVATRTAAYAAALLYVRAQVNDAPISYRSVTLPADTSLPVLLGWGGAVLGFACLTALASYASDALSFDIGRRYAKYGAGRVLKILAGTQPVRLPNEGAEGKLATPVGFATRLLGGGMNLLIRTLMQAITGLGPLLVFAVAATTLFYINVWLTVALLGVMVGYAVPFYWFNRDIVQASRDRETYSKRAIRLLSRYLPFITQTRYDDVPDPDWGAAYAQGEDVNKGVDAFRLILMTKKKVEVLKEVALGAAIALLLIGFGSVVAHTQASWDVLLAYIVALQWAMVSMNSVAQRITVMNRMLPQITRYVAFRRINEEREPRREREVPEAAPSRLELQAPEPDLPNSLPQVGVETGQVVCVVYRPSLDRGSLDLFLRRLTKHSDHSARALAPEVFFHGAAAPPPLLTLSEIVSGGAPGEPERDARIHALLERAGVLEEYLELRGDGDPRMTAELEEKLGPKLAYWIGVVHGLVRQRRYAVLTASSLKKLNSEAQTEIFQLLADRIVFWIHDSAPRQLPAPADWSVVVGEKAIRGMGDADWYASVQEQLAAEERAQEGASLEDDESLDDALFES